jgi:hypothetical protein
MAGEGAQRRLEATDDIEDYELVTDDNVCPECLGAMIPGQVICTTCGYDRNTGKITPKIEFIPRVMPEVVPGGLRGFLRRWFGDKKGANSEPRHA